MDKIGSSSDLVRSNKLKRTKEPGTNLVIVLTCGAEAVAQYVASLLGSCAQSSRSFVSVSAVDILLLIQKESNPITVKSEKDK